MKKIIVPTDFSKCSMNALKVAHNIAKSNQAKLILVHTYQIPTYGYSTGYVMYVDPETNKVKEELTAALNKLSEEDFLKGVQVESKLLMEFNVEDILTHDELKDADLIVMGTHGTSDWSEDIMGSNAERMIRKSSCPVLVLRENTPTDFNPKKLVFASTFFGEVYNQFPKIKALAESYGAEIHLLYVNTPNEFNTTAYSHKVMDSFKKRFQIENAETHIYNHLTVEEGVNEFCHAINADLLVMETHGRTGISHLLKGSIVEDLANHIDIPLMTIKIVPVKTKKGVIFPEV